MDGITWSKEMSAIPCEQCRGTGVLAPASPASRFRRSASYAPAPRGRRSSAPEHGAYSSSLRTSLSTQPYSQYAGGIASSSAGASAFLAGSSRSSHQQQEELHAKRDVSLDSGSSNLGPQETQVSLHQQQDQDIAEQPEDRTLHIEPDQGNLHQSSQPTLAASPNRERSQMLDTMHFTDTHWGRPSSLAPPLRSVSRLQSGLQSQSRYSSSPSSMSSGATAPLLPSHANSNNSNTNVDTVSISGAINVDGSGSGSGGSAVAAHGSNSHDSQNTVSNASNIRSATSQYNGSISSSGSRSSSSSKPKLPPIKHLLDDIDDWPQVRAARASSGRSIERESAFESGIASRAATPEAFNLAYSSTQQPPSPQHHHMFTRPILISLDKTSTVNGGQHPPPRPYHLAEGDHDGYSAFSARNNSNSRVSSSAPIPASALASATTSNSSGKQAMRERDEPISVHANKKLRRQSSSSPRDRMSALSLEAVSDSPRETRPSIMAHSGHADKYHSYFADAKINDLKDEDSEGHGYRYSLHGDDGRSLHALGDDTVIGTPSLEATRGAELEAAIHLAGIAASGNNERPRGSTDRIYVTTSTAPTLSGTNRAQAHPEAMQRQPRPLAVMGAYSDQSSYGTAPSLATDASTFAESSHSGGLNRSPSNSVVLYMDEAGEISPPTSNGLHADAQQQLYRQQQIQPVLSDPDNFNGSNGTGKYFCAVCQKRFTRPSALAVHSHMHTGAKPFACQICDRSFSVNSNLRRHMKTHSGDEITALDQ